MNRYDYYTRHACFDEQEWLTEELYYPENDEDLSVNRKNAFVDEEEALCQEFLASLFKEDDMEEGEGELCDEEWEEAEDSGEETERR